MCSRKKNARLVISRLAEILYILLILYIYFIIPYSSYFIYPFIHFLEDISNFATLNSRWNKGYCIVLWMSPVKVGLIQDDGDLPYYERCVSLKTLKKNTLFSTAELVYKAM